MTGYAQDPDGIAAVRIITDEDGPGLHILRPGRPPQVHRLTVNALSALMRDAALALDEKVRQGGRIIHENE